MKIVVLIFCRSWCRRPDQSRSAVISNAPPEIMQSRTNRNAALVLRMETLRMECIQNRRLICGKIVKVLPDGLVVDSGYLDLLRRPVVPGSCLTWSAPAARPI